MPKLQFQERNPWRAMSVLDAFVLASLIALRVCAFDGSETSGTPNFFWFAVCCLLFLSAVLIRRTYSRSGVLDGDELFWVISLGTILVVHALLAGQPIKTPLDFALVSVANICSIAFICRAPLLNGLSTIQRRTSF